jgi:hypothetical protein
MKPKNNAVFRADAFPDDTVEDEHDIQVFPGRNIAEVLTPMLQEAGCTDISEPLHEHEHGWHVVFRYDRKLFYLQVSRIEPETIVSFYKNYGSDGLFYKGPSRHELLLEKLRPLLDADARFEELKWYTQEEMHTKDWLLEVRAPAEDEGKGTA